MAKQKKMPTPKAPNSFQVGDRVRVKLGTMDPDYSDLPLGGWAGTITEIDRFGFHTVRWSEETLANIHPLYKERCDRDGVMLEEYWLEESDLEPDSGGPLRIEPPQAMTPEPLSPEPLSPEPPSPEPLSPEPLSSEPLSPEPLSSDNPGDRVRMVFHLTPDDRLPMSDADALATYYEYLSERLRFPFAARYETCKFCKPSPSRQVEVVSLDSDWSWDELDGIFCEVHDGDKVERLPLTNLSVPYSNPNYHLIDDYTQWFEGELSWFEDHPAPKDRGAYEDEDAKKGGKVPDAAGPLEKIRKVSWLSALMMAFSIAVYTGCATATIGSAVAAMSWAVWTAGIGALISGGYAAWVADRAIEPRPASTVLRIACNSITVLVGGLFGALFGAMVAAFVGALPGWGFGYLVERQWVRPKHLRLVNFSSITGASIGAIVFAVYWDDVQAIMGLGAGAIIGTAAGMLLGLAFTLLVKVMAPREVGQVTK